ncbi:3-hydroxyacyl-ACP dehydratase [Streptomyces sp. NPDC001407]|uniref:3-hydroxyacyl-ACP dehydratase n=1 Tax=Streptomyces sp. NPDC001407 TaxID=3364573 RepID=UPI00368B3707
MEELTFEGVPLPGPAPAGTGRAAGTEAATAPAVRLAQCVQQAHASVLQAVHAVTAWQLAKAGTPPGALPAVPGVTDVLHTAAAALGTAGVDPAHASLTVTWHRRPSQVAAALRVRRRGDRWEVLAADEAVADLAIARGDPWPPREPPRHPPDPRPLARTTVNSLTAAGLDALAAGDFAGVLGAAFDQRDQPPDALPAPWPARTLDAVTTIDPRGGRYAQGFVRATAHLPADGHPWPHLLAMAMEALRVHAFHQGLHLCLPGARPGPLTGRPVLVEMAGAPAPGPAELCLDVEISATGMLPRPHVIADCHITSDDRPLARMRDVGIALHERPGLDLLDPHRRSYRKSVNGQRAWADELHAAAFAEGDHREFRLPGIGPLITAPVRPRLPRGDLRMLDRIQRVEGEWGEYLPGSGGTGEYDVPEDPWYVRENGGTLPQLALMEIALQPAGLFSGALGVSGEYPDRDLSCRNLDGTARLLRETELRGATVEQQVTLRAHSALPGGIMHRYDFALRTGGETFYTGEAVHGFLTPELLAQQQGLDGGAHVPPWLDRQSPAPDAHRLDLREDTRLGHGRLALLEDVILVPEGGDHGNGYVLCTKPVRPDDWYFHHHFFRDPVMPGSAGVQMLYQAVHAFALHTGLLADLPGARCAVAVGEELHWSYRGQILREHQRVRGEVHIREARRRGERLLLCADGSIWRDGLRIYQVDNIALDIRESGEGHR